MTNYIARGRQVVTPLTNQSGGGVIAGDVVIISAANDESFTTTTSAAYNATRVGIAQETIAAGATGRILIEGYAPLVNVSASATRGHYLLTHTVAKQATSQAGYAAGAFGQILKAGTTPSAEIFPVSQLGSAGVTRSGSTTDGHLAVWNGSDAESIKDGGVNTAGALILLEQHTGAGASTATLDFATAISATYDEYLFEFVNVVPATDNVNFRMLVSTDGTNYLGTSVYVAASHRATDNGAAQAGQAIASPTTILALDGGSTMDNSSNWGICGHMRLFSPGNTSVFTRITADMSFPDNAGHLITARIAGAYIATTAVVKVRFLFSSGDVASGTIRCYGVAKA